MRTWSAHLPWLPALAAGLLIVGCAPGREPVDAPRASAPQTVLRPAIACQEPVHRFGRVLQGARVSHAFQLRNEGPGRLRIERVRTACAVSAAWLPPTRLEPGQELALEVELDTRGLEGPLERRIEVLSDDPDRPALALALLGEVELAAAFAEAVLDLGWVGQDATAVAWIGLRGRLSAAVQLGELELVGPEGLGARPVERDGSPGLEVSLRAGRTLGPLEGRVTARTGLADPTWLNLPVRAEVVGDLRPTPPSASFDPFVPDSPPEATLGLRSARGQSFRVLAVEDPAGAVEAVLPRGGLAPGATVALRLRLARSPGAPRGALLIHTDHPEQPWLELPYAVRTEPRPPPPPEPTPPPAAGRRARDARAPRK
jgi:hypothetical protein